MAQENMGDWMEYAREYAKAQREMKIEKWVCITIEYRTKERQRVVLFRYDLPRDVYERRQWVVRWRHARLLCQYPKENVQTYFSYYAKFRRKLQAKIGKYAELEGEVMLSVQNVRLQYYLNRF